MDMIVGRGVKYANLLLRSSAGLSRQFYGASARCLCQCDTRRQNPRAYDTNIRWRLITGGNYLPANNSIAIRINVRDCFAENGRYALGFATGNTQPTNNDCQQPPPPPEKQTIFQRMKQMTKDYWHILIPVHVVTSIGWISLFYIAAKNGVDVVRILEAMNLSDRYLDILRGSNAGHWAVAYALYKLFTPIRYTVTVGGTTMSIRYLNRWGYLKFKPRSTIKETQSESCAAEQREKYVKPVFKNEQQTERPKTEHACLKLQKRNR